MANDNGGLMKKTVCLLVMLVLTIPLLVSCGGLDKTIVFETTMGNFEIKLYSDTPIASKNMLDRVNSGFYDGVSFHRVIKDFMIQAGYPVKPDTKTGDMPLDPHPGRPNIPGAVCMASSSQTRPIEIQSDSQFFINVADNAHLDPSFINPKTKQEERGFGFIPFAQVVSGMEVCDKISKVECNTGDKPLVDVVINKAYVK